VPRQPRAGDTKRSRALTSLGGLGNPSRLKFPVGRSIGTPAGKSALSPDGDIITIPVYVLALNYQCRPISWPAPKPGKGPFTGTGISGKSGFFIHHRQRRRTRFTRHP
jgi:hypothetical protein